MRILPQELIILRLRGKKIVRGIQARRAMDELYSKSDEECFAELRLLSDLDFGKDLNKWEEWVKESVLNWEKESGETE